MSRTGITGDCRDELEHHPDGRGSPELRDLLGDYGEAWGIESPERPGMPFRAVPRRSGLPPVAGKTLGELRQNMDAAAAAARLTDILSLEAEFPAWRVFRSSTGEWWATRLGRLTAGQQDAGLHSTVGGDVRTPGKLRELLAEQGRIEEWAAAHDWQVPGDDARRELGLPPEGKEFRGVSVPADTGADPPRRM